MPQPIGRDLEVTSRKLQSWLSQRLPAARNLRIENLRGPKDTGFSSDTLMFDLHYEEKGQPRHQSLVVRLKPMTDFGVFPEYDVALQFHMMKALEATPVPAPRMLWLEDDPAPLGSPFYVMERLEGQVPSDSPPYQTTGWIFDLPAADRTRLWWSGLEAMARVHKLDWSVPAFSFLPRPAAGLTPLQAQLAYWNHYMDWGMDRSRHPLLETCLRWLKANQPADEPTAICWGDARISNQIFSGCECIAVIDWEMVFLGNPLADLAWFIGMDRCFTEGIGVKPLAGIPSKAETIARWQAHTGMETKHFPYYEVFGSFRFAAIMGRLFLQMKHYGLIPQEASVDQDNLSTVVLRSVMAEVGVQD